MKVKDLERTRPDYAKTTWERYRLLYQGGQAIDDKAGQFLIRHSAEHPGWYAERLKRFHYANRISPIVGEFSASVFQSEPGLVPAKEGQGARPDAPPFYADFFRDPQGNGAGTFAELLHGRFVDALQTSEAWLHLDFPAVDGARQDRGQQEEAGDLRALLRPIDAETVVHLQEDGEGLAAVMLRWRIRMDIPGEPEPKHETIRWQRLDRTTVTTWEVKVEKGKQPDPEQEAEQVAHFEHRLAQHGRVPMVRLKLEPHLWLLNLVGPLAVHELNKRNNVSWVEDLACFPQLKHTGGEALDSAERESRPRRGVQYVWELADKEETLDWLEIEGRSLAHLAKRLESTREEIMRTVHLMASAIGPGAAAQVQSAASKVRDSVAKRLVAEEFAKAVKKFAGRAIELVTLARQDDVGWEATGLDRHDLADSDSLVERHVTAQGVDVRSETHHKLMQKTFAREFHKEATSEELDTINQEIEAANVSDLVERSAPLLGEPDGEDE